MVNKKHHTSLLITRGRQIFTIIIAVMVSVTLVAFVVTATTTVGNNVSIGGALTVTSTSTLATTSLTVLEASGEVVLMSNVGIATTSPKFRLEVVGTSTDGFFGVSQNSAGDLFMINNSGNIGIGTTTPRSKLHVFDDSTGALVTVESDAATGQALIQTDSGGDKSSGLKVKQAGTNIFYFGGLGDSAIDWGLYDYTAPGWTIQSAEGRFLFGTGVGSVDADSPYFSVLGDGSDTSFEVYDEAINADFTVSGNGNVGVGTTTPRALLEIHDRTATSTLFIGSGVALPGVIILEDTDGGGCTLIKVLDGAIESETVVCPTQ